MEYTDFYIAQEKAHISPITTDAIYYVTADAGYHIVHSRPADHMILVATMRGHGRILLNGQSLDLNADDILVFDASCPIEYYCTGINWTFWWFEFRCTEPDFITLPADTVLSLPLNDSMLYLCQESLESLKLNDSKTSSFLFSSLLCLLQKKSREISRPDGMLELFQKADRYIHGNLATVTVESTARHLNISERTLLNVFQTLLGVPTANYIRNLKMDMAQHLLTASAYTIREISDFLGYADPFTFSKSFHRYFDLSPREYRKAAIPANKPLSSV